MHPDPVPLSSRVEATGQWAADFLLGEPGRQLPAVMQVIDHVGTVINYGAFFRGEDDKESFSLLMKAAIVAHRAQAYVYVSETWQVRMPVAEHAAYKSRRVQPKDDPNRRECVAVFARSREEAIAANWAIRRSPDGRIMDLVREEPRFSLTSATGRFMPEFPPQKLVIPQVASLIAGIAELMKRYGFFRFEATDVVQKQEVAS